MDRRALTVGTRGSMLALKQTELIVNTLRQYLPQTQFIIKVIKTGGDRDQTGLLQGGSLKGYFVKEIEEALLGREIDFAVHSYKDLGVSTVSHGLSIAAVPLREDPRDLFIAGDGVSRFTELREGASIGTNSLRRSFQLKLLRPDLCVVPMRGNITTRIERAVSGEYDGVVLACAGINRCGITGYATTVFSVEEIVPAPAQGALAVQCRSDDRHLYDVLRQLNDPMTEAAVNAERHCARFFDAGCTTPLGVYGSFENGGFRLTGIYFEGDTPHRRSVTTERSRYLEAAETLAGALLQK